MAKSSKGIVLSRKSFGESDQYIEFLTQDWGVITVLAKGARKSLRRYVGGLDLFCHDEIFLKGEPNERTAYLLELKVINSFPLLRENFDKLMAAGRWIQWVRKIGNTNVSMPQMYRLVGQTLSLLEQEPELERLELMGLVFKWKLLSYLGIRPKMNLCAKCILPLGDLSYFDISAGGLLCKNCSAQTGWDESYYVSNKQKNFLEGLDEFKWIQWQELTHPKGSSLQLSRLLTQFASFHSHAKLM